MNKDSEGLTTRIMEGLRDAQAPEGMEDRIVKALRERTALQPATPGWRFALPWKWSAAAGTMIAACVVLSIFMHHRAERRPAIVSPTSSFPTIVETRPSEPPQSFAHTAQETRSLKIRRASTVHTGSAARPETLSVSYPAPPMPLTEQETLLLRLAHKGDPIELAMLDPLQRAAQNAAEKADFQRFFNPLPPPSVTGDTK